MATLIEYRQKKALLEQLQKQLEAIEADPVFAKDLEFVDKLRALQKKYDKSDKDVLAIINPRQTAPVQLDESGNRKRKHRPVRVFKNPHTGEVVEAKSVAHLTLKAWIREHGKPEVESWVVETKSA